LKAFPLAWCFDLRQFLALGLRYIEITYRTEAKQLLLWLSGTSLLLSRSVLAGFLGSEMMGAKIRMPFSPRTALAVGASSQRAPNRPQRLRYR
jgi:hypothetical protein